MFLLRIGIIGVLLALGACSNSTPIQNPELGSARDDVVQIKPDSFILMSGLPPQQFKDHWLVIVTYTEDSAGALIEVRPQQQLPGQRIEVYPGDTIAIGEDFYQILAVEDKTRQLAWVEIDTTPQP